ncbi:MAG: cyclic nucleotide-binding domain-containing protein [Candidatus Obscuribacterales bacterium]|nr:cyclic nucleotide-binding domain-containing protein [Candidatus Obscuribacterales bacterium]
MTEKNLEVAEFLKNESIFNVLEMNVLESLSLLFHETVCGPGHIVFREGQEPDGLYVIKSGSVAVLQGSPAKVLAYLTAGECFGEMAVIKDGPRNATVRVPEEATVLRLPGAALKEVAHQFPALTSKITEIIEKRSSGRVSFKPPGLQGNLAFFDLPTVIQTIVGSRQNGVLTLYGRGGRKVGRMILKNASISAASFDHLRGEHALYELMNSSDPLDFTFDRLETADSEIDAELSKRPPHMLMIEGARRADELPKLMKSVGWPSSIYEQLKTVPDLASLGTERRELLRSMWNLVEMGCNTDSICKQLPADRYAILTLLEEILNLNWVKKVPGPKVTDELKRRTGQIAKPNLEDLKKQAMGVSSRTEKRTGTMEHPAELVRVINSFNAVSSNLGMLYGKLEVRMVLQEALAKVSKIFPTLSGLRIHIDNPCLDMRGVSSEFSESPDTIAGILLLGNYLMDLLVRMQNI